MRSASLILALAGFLTACAPSTENAEQTLRQQIQSESKGQIALVSFSKTDGQKVEIMRVQGYKLDFEGEIEFAKDGVWLSQDSYDFNHSGLTWALKPASDNAFQGLMNNIAGGTTPVKRGDRKRIAGQIVAEKKESGWVFQVGDSRTKE